MKFFLKIVLVAFCCILCIGFNSFIIINDLENFKAIHIINTWQIPQKTGDHITFTRSPDIIYSKSYEILREPYPITNTYVKVDSLGKEVLDKNHPSTSKIGYSFFICRKGEKYGMHYSSISDSTGNVYAVDSLIKDFLRFPSLFYTGRGSEKDSIKVIKDDKKGYLTEIITNRKKSETDPDSSYFYYRKKPLAYSFLIKDKRADNMYLYKAIIIYNHIPKSENINNVSEEKTKFRQSFELSDIDVPDIESLKIIINKFKSTK